MAPAACVAAIGLLQLQLTVFLTPPPSRVRCTGLRGPQRCVPWSHARSAGNGGRRPQTTGRRHAHRRRSIGRCMRAPTARPACDAPLLPAAAGLRGAGGTAAAGAWGCDGGVQGAVIGRVARVCQHGARYAAAVPGPGPGSARHPARGSRAAARQRTAGAQAMGPPAAPARSPATHSDATRGRAPHRGGGGAAAGAGAAAPGLGPSVRTPTSPHAVASFQTSATRS